VESDEVEEAATGDEGLRRRREPMRAHGEDPLRWRVESDLLEPGLGEPAAYVGRPVRRKAVSGPDHGRALRAETRQGDDRGADVGIADVAENAAGAVVEASPPPTSSLGSPASAAARRAAATLRGSSSTIRAATCAARGWPASAPTRSRASPPQRLSAR